MIKKFLVFVTLVAGFSTAFMSCKGPVNEKGEEIEHVRVSTANYDNHKYLIFYINGSIDKNGVVHDPNCKCHGNN